MSSLSSRARSPERLPRFPASGSAAIGVIAGTLFGTRLLRRIPERRFNVLVSVSVLALGIYMLVRGVQAP